MRRLLLALVALLAFTAPASAQTVINSVPFTISQSGQYKLGNNLITGSASQVAITISAPNVILDLDGFFVSGPGTSTTSTQAVISVGNFSNVTIRNGTVANNGYGIFFSFGANSINQLVEDVNVTRCLLAGIYFQSNSASSVVRRCTVSQIAGYTTSAASAAGVFCGAGVRLETNFINTVTGGTFNGNTGVGRGINQDAGSFAIGNTLTNCLVGIEGGKYKDNLTSNCATPFTGGTASGGNN